MRSHSRRVGKNELRAEVNSAGIENRTALHCAVYDGRLEAVRLLLRFGAASDARTLQGRTCLHIACILGEEQMCRLLLGAGASVSVQDFDENTPVHYAAFYSIDCVHKQVRRERDDIEIVGGEETGPDDKEQEGTDAHRHNEQQIGHQPLLALPHRQSGRDRGQGATKGGEQTTHSGQQGQAGGGGDRDKENRSRREGQDRFHGLRKPCRHQRGTEVLHYPPRRTQAGSQRSAAAATSPCPVQQGSRRRWD